LIKNREGGKRKEKGDRAQGEVVSDISLIRLD